MTSRSGRCWPQTGPWHARQGRLEPATRPNAANRKRGPRPVKPRPKKLRRAGARRAYAGAVRQFSCRVVVGYCDGRLDLEDDDADLSLGDGALVLAYWDEQGAVVFAGAEAEPGRFELTARSRPRRCTLLREDARTFTGSWAQGEECGTLRVVIPDEGDGATEAR